MGLSIYIKSNNSTHLDLFENESIDLVVKSKDLKDLSKSFADYVRSFSVPATDNNIKALGYQTERNITKSYYNLKEAVIYIDGMIFKRGKIKVTEAKYTNYNLEYFKVEFRTGIAEIKEIIGDTKVSDLDFSAYKYVWNDTTAFRYLNRGESENDNFLLSLTSNYRVWNTSQNDINDITKDSGAITVKELTPAFRVSEVFKVIFNDLFTKRGYKTPYFPELNSSFKDAYVYLTGVNSDSKTNKILVNKNNFDVTNGYLSSFDLKQRFDDTGWVDVNHKGNNNSRLVKYMCGINNIVNSDTLEPYKDSVTISIEYIGNDSVQVISGTPDDNGNLRLETTMLNKLIGISAFRVKIVSDSNIRYSTMSTVVQNIFAGWSFTTWGKTEFYDSQFGYYNYDIAKGFGNMKVIDFLSACMKTINASVIVDGFKGNYIFASQKEAENALNPSEFYMTSFDITPYLNHDDFVQRKQQEYKEFNVSFKESKMYRNKAYRSVALKEYGSEVYKDVYSDSKDVYKIESGCSILPYYVLEGTSNLLTSYLFESVGSKTSTDYPIIAYANEQVNILDESGNLKPIKLRRESFTFNQNNYVIFNNRISNHSFTYDRYIDPLDGTSPEHNLFRFYKKDIETISDKKSFYYDYSIKIPPALIMYLNTNGVLKLHGRSVKIEELSISLTTGEGKVTLYDYRDKYELEAPYEFPVVNGFTAEPTLQDSNINKRILCKWESFSKKDFDYTIIDVVSIDGKTVYSEEDHYWDSLPFLTLNKEKTDALNPNLVYFCTISTFSYKHGRSRPVGSQPFSIKK